MTNHQNSHRNELIFYAIALGLAVLALILVGCDREPTPDWSTHVFGHGDNPRYVQIRSHNGWEFFHRDQLKPFHGLEIYRDGVSMTFEIIKDDSKVTRDKFSDVPQVKMTKILFRIEPGTYTIKGQRCRPGRCELFEQEIVIP